MEEEQNIFDFSPETHAFLQEVYKSVYQQGAEYVTPEHCLYILLGDKRFKAALLGLAIDSDSLDTIKDELEEYLASLPKRAEKEEPFYLSHNMTRVFTRAMINVQSAGKQEIEIPHLIAAMINLQDSMVSYLICQICDGDDGELMREVIVAFLPQSGAPDPDGGLDELEAVFARSDAEKEQEWKKYVVDVISNLEGRNPLIGREAELDRTVQILCRKDKNNPLHVGDPGVGKTALIYGLARMIDRGEVPEDLKTARIYILDVGTILAGTQYRGDFERRLDMIMQGAMKEDNPIIYIDEIHTLVGAGATGEGAMDASNMLKPYLETGRIRFIGSTTHEEFNRYFSKSKGLVRRFSRIDIDEPSAEQTIEILHRLKENYERYHGVRYDDEAIEYAVKGSVRHIPERRLPDKAIDLIDEAGAYCRIHGGDDASGSVVNKDLIAGILAKMCKVESLAVTDDSAARLEDLKERLERRIYGQSGAVDAVVEAVWASKAGLADETKPLASFLFVGPTGVGKTELSKALADELGIGLVRFDMSEYAEKHAVAKLIGSPAGYVGYEDGGLLTDAIRKTPDCVLLFDEIEKAHPDIYNILLQVMDYGRLTDNKGNVADFRNVVIILTSNAGARFAAQANVGFGSNVSSGEAMMKTVKKTFQPEFMNRLSATVLFRDMDRRMAEMVLDKKLRQLEDRLKGKGIVLTLSGDARAWILEKGFSREYGAREMDRVINSSLTPLLTRAILFGPLKSGGEARIEMERDALVLH